MYTYVLSQIKVAEFELLVLRFAHSLLKGTAGMPYFPLVCVDTLRGGPSGVCTYRKICVFCASVTVLNGFPGGECGVYLPELQREGLQSPEVAGRRVLFIPLPKSSLCGCKVLLTLGPQVHWRGQEIVC